MHARAVLSLAFSAFAVARNAQSQAVIAIIHFTDGLDRPRGIATDATGNVFPAG